MAGDRGSRLWNVMYRGHDEHDELGHPPDDLRSADGYRHDPMDHHRADAREHRDRPSGELADQPHWPASRLLVGHRHLDRHVATVRAFGHRGGGDLLSSAAG